MADRGDHLHEVLDGYAKFLQPKNLALNKHQPYLVRWVREFLLFARTRAGCSFDVAGPLPVGNMVRNASSRRLGRTGS